MHLSPQVIMCDISPKSNRGGGNWSYVWVIVMHLVTRVEADCLEKALYCWVKNGNFQATDSIPSLTQGGSTLTRSNFINTLVFLQLDGVIFLFLSFGILQRSLTCFAPLANLTITLYKDQLLHGHFKA